MRPAAAIAAISLTSADPERLAVFFEHALGFARAGTSEHGGVAFGRLMGLPVARARSLRLRLGAQEVELLGFADQGAPYPPQRAGNDRFFQHFAIVVTDMERAYARLRDSVGWTPITTPTPQRLPESSGGVTAFKFRDREGHPLELVEFPRERTPPPWRDRSAAGPAVGIDHSAIVVTDSAASIAFYEGLLGFSVAARSLNRGAGQERLDGLSGAVVEVTAMANEAHSAPHLELLCYRAPKSRGDSICASNDIAATRLVIGLSDKQSLAARLEPARRSLVSAGVVVGDDGGAQALLRDPDGHMLLLTA